MPDPRVIFVNRVYWPNESATAQLLTDLAEGLVRLGHEVHVICGGEGEATRSGVHIHRVGGEAGHRGFVHQARNYVAFALGARRALRCIVNAGDLVVVKTDPPLLAAVATSPARVRGAEVIQWIQDIYPEILPLHYGRWLRALVLPLRALRNRAWRSSAACVVVGEDMRATVSAQGVASSRLHTLPNWAPAECSTTPPAAAVEAQRRTWGAGERIVICYSGNHGRVHEFSTLLEAARALHDDPAFLFIFIGAGPRRSEVEGDARRLGLRNVLFLPPAPRASLAASLGAADIHVVTLRPGFEAVVNPSKLTGILAAGRPALWIGPRSSASARLLEESSCGIAVENGDVASLVDSIRRLKSTALRHELGAAARRTFESEFSFEIQLQRWDALLRSLRRQST